MKSLSSFAHWIKLVLAGNLLALITTISIITAILILPAIALGIELFYWGHFSSIDLLESSNFFSIGCIVFAGYYGMLRVICFHPLFAARYHQWLLNSCWELGLPLPIGPLHPVWQDFALLGIITIVSGLLSPIDNVIVAWLSPATAMAGAMAFFWTVGNLKASQFPYLYALLFVLPLALNAAIEESFILMQFGFFLCATIAYLGARNSLKDLRDLQPIDFKQIAKSMNEPIRGDFWSNSKTVRAISNIKTSIAWPYEQLLIPPKEFRKSLTKAWLHSLIVMIWAFLFYQLSKADGGRNAIMFQYLFWYFVVGGITIWRLRCGSYAICPRLCLGERFANRKLFLSKHDRLILEPIVIVCCSYLPVAIGSYLTENGGSAEWHRIGLMIGPIIGTFMHHTIGKPIEDSFYHRTAIDRRNLYQRGEAEPIFKASSTRRLNHA